jgi:glycosyltransferase involved in cell wall biosynthesis
MKLVVAHTGARRGYAVPSILETAGMLERFYTDICADVGLGHALTAVLRLGLHTRELNRLAARRLPTNIVDKTMTFTMPNLRYYLSRHRSGCGAEAFLANIRWQCELGERMARAGFGNADWLHSFLDEFPTLIVAAKQRGLRVVSEIYILLSSDRLLRDERRQFPGWEEDVPDFEKIGREAFGERVLFTHSDFILCPSESVRDDAVGNFGFCRERSLVVPYGVADAWFRVRNNPVRRRVLFVGTAGLRKGIHYLGMASEHLARRGLSCDFRVAGKVQQAVVAQPVCRQLQFLGSVARDEIANEFTQADVLVLPSLVEGSAGVTYEALAAGCL